MTLDVEVPQAPASVTKVDPSTGSTASAESTAAAQPLPPALHIATTSPLGHQVADAGIAHVLLDAYQSAVARVPASCNLPVSLLAAIGEVESGSLVGRSIDAHHRTFVLGPVLDGNGFAAIPDTDNGRLDGNTQWDRAMGPMQFVPSTWSTFGVDGDGDGVADPQNVYDAAASAAGYLCYGGRDLSQPSMLSAAILSYNHSTAYERLVLTYQARYAGLGLDQGSVSALPSAAALPVAGALGSTTVATFAPGLQPTGQARPSAHHSHAAKKAAKRSHRKGSGGRGSGGNGNGGPTPSGPTVSPAGTPSDPTGGSPSDGPSTTPGPTDTPAPTPADTPTPTPTDTPTPTPTDTPTPTPSDTPTPSPTDTPTPSPTDTPTPTDTPSSPSDPATCPPPQGTDPTCPPCDPAPPSDPTNPTNPPTDPGTQACTPPATGQESALTSPSTTSSP